MNLRNLTNDDASVHFTSTEIIRTLSSKELYTVELQLLSSGLRFSIPSLKLRKMNVYVSFEKMYQFMEDLCNDLCFL